MALMGMEHILHFLLTVAFAAAAITALGGTEADDRRRRHRTMALSLLGALLGAARYEGFFLVAVACLALLVRRQFVRALSLALAAALPVAVFGALSVANGAFFLPNSLVLKAAGESASVLSALFKPPGREDLAFFANSRHPDLSARGPLRRRSRATNMVRTGQGASSWMPLRFGPLRLGGPATAHRDRTRRLRRRPRLRPSGAGPHRYRPTSRSQPTEPARPGRY
jgi:hypothetical protein